MIKRKRSKPRPGRLQGEALEALRLACFARDNNECQNCGQHVNPNIFHLHPYSAHMAHIKAKRMGGDSLDNVRTECGHCHREYHEFGPSRIKPCPSK